MSLQWGLLQMISTVTEDVVLKCQTWLAHTCKVEEVLPEGLSMHGKQRQSLYP